MTSAGSRTKTGSLIDVIFVAKGVAIVVGEILIRNIKNVMSALEERNYHLVNAGSIKCVH